MSENTRETKQIWMLVSVAALGYFVDVYDLLLFSAIRTASLADIGVPSGESLTVGLSLLNWQMTGLIAGGLLWGVVGDKKGRLAVLFGSIITYSLANLLNAHVQTIEQYQWLRFFAGLGLAGELGAGITLVTEVMPKEKRGIGTTIIGSFGLLGASLASWVALKLGWRTAFTAGGIMGLALLILRLGVSESAMFERLRNKPIERGNLSLLVKRPSRLGKLLVCVLVGLPVYFVVGLLITGAPEFGRALGIGETPKGAIAVMLAYIGMSVGDVVCGAVSQLWKSRRLALLTFGALSALTIAVFLFVPGGTLVAFYWRCAAVGFGVGFWALINTNTAEQFGTNVRATVATLSPNLIRASLIPIAWCFNGLKDDFGVVPTAAVVGGFCVLVSIVSTICLKETFGVDLDYNEE